MKSYTIVYLIYGYTHTEITVVGHVCLPCASCLQRTTMILELSCYEYSGLCNYCELEISNTGCPMISTSLKIRKPVIIDDMADKYVSFCWQYDAVFYHIIFVMLVYFNYLYNVNAKLF